MRKAIVVGAGLAGLTAAYRLNKAGWKVTVFDAASEVGGRAVSVNKQGYIFDSGAVGFGTVYKEMLELIHEVGLADRIVNSSTIAGTIRNGKIYEIDSAKPLTALTSKLLSFGSKLKMVTLMRDLGKIKPHLNIANVGAASQFDDETVEAYAKRRLNPELLEYFIEPLARTVNLSRASRISKLEVMNSLAGLFATKLIHLRGGVGLFSQTLAKDLDVKLNTPVQQITRFNDHVEVSYRDQSGTTATDKGDVCVLATTLPQAVELFPEARTLLAPLSTSIQYNRGLDVHLGYKTATKTKALMAMMPPSEHKEIALFFMEHNKAPDRAPPGHSMITVFFDHTAADRPWALDDAALIKETSAIVEKYLPELAGQLEMSQVTRWPLGLTNPDVGIFKAMQEVNNKLNPADRIQFAGDYRSAAGQNSAVAWGNNVARDLIKHFPA
jgi:protoporphyrinogen/coproporphyrinogen III oxidase